MTSASELFYNRRSRFGRSAVELGFDSSHHHNHRHRHATDHHSGGITASNIRRDFDGCDPHRRSSHLRHSLHRPSERDDRSSTQSASFDVNAFENGINRRNRLSSTRNDRLPGDVLRARERLLERLRGVSLSGSRQNNRLPSSTYRNDFITEDDFRLADTVDWESGISRDWGAETSPFTNSLQRETSKKPRGLTQEALNCLLVEVFHSVDRCDEEITSTTLQDCSICLESFEEGDKLIYLTCGHRFHHSCLDPWLRICACCPYCRKDIVVTITKT